MTIYNFAAGPATLPAAVLQEAQRDLTELPGVGMSLLEMSHRSKPVVDMIDRAEDDIRQLAGIPDNYKVLFLQGGASLQFSMVPMNLLTPTVRPIISSPETSPTWRCRTPKKSAIFEWLVPPKKVTSTTYPARMNWI